MQKVRRYNELPIVALAFKCAEKSGFELNMGNLVEAVGQIKVFILAPHHLRDGHTAVFLT
jgi:hypothetical protein